MLSHVSHPIEDSQSPSNLIQLKELKKKKEVKISLHPF